MAQGSEERNQRFPSGWQTIDWTVMDDLVNLSENEHLKGSLLLGKVPDLEDYLRRVLRPHDEAGFVSPRDDWMVRLRTRLDAALGALTQLEIRYELSLPEPPQPIGLNLNNLRTLFQSQAFLRYINAYLFFGIRFLAERDVWGVSLPPARPNSIKCDTNLQTFPLACPPPLSYSTESAEHLVRFNNLPIDSEIQVALDFLDAIHRATDQAVQYELEEPTEYELWCRGLFPEAELNKTLRFEQITRGLEKWAISRSDFYLSLSPAQTYEIASGEVSGKGTRRKRPAAGWLVKNPVAARIALADVYWIARILRADVASDASVTYQRRSWLQILRFHLILEHDSRIAQTPENPAGERAVPFVQPTQPPQTVLTEIDLNRLEEVLRSVFDFVCDVVQNSVEVSRAREVRTAEEERGVGRGGRSVDSSDVAVHWRAAFDEELNEIDQQRAVRHFRDPSLPPESIASPSEPESASTSRIGGPESQNSGPPRQKPGSIPSPETWSERIRTGKRPENLIGLAFSGGGIRSATFNLGILQGLQELDILRHVDYLSTVSGGGFIGSWLVANVRRTTQWLGRLTDWSESIAHLRAYSNYLAPRTGILSADTYNLANSWFRNAVLIQLTGLAWLFVIVLTAILGLRLFIHLNDLRYIGIILRIASALLVTLTVLYNLRGQYLLSRRSMPDRSSWVLGLAVTPAWIGAFCLSSEFWLNASVRSTVWPHLHGCDTYSGIVKAAFRDWPLLLVCTALALFILVIVTTQVHRAPRWVNSIWVSLLCTGVLYLELVGIFLLFREWHEARNWLYGALAYVLGPSLILMAFSLCVLLLIGLTGRHTDEALREWWTRFGTWLAIYAGISLFICGIAVIGPWLIHKAIYWPSAHPNTLKAIKWASVFSWLGTVAAGVFAGKSSKTSGEGNSPALEALAKVGAVLFIVGSFLLGSTLIYCLLVAIFPNTLTFKHANPVAVLLRARDAGGLFSSQIFLVLAVCTLVGLLFSWCFEINIFGLNQFYRNRLVRCYLGATRWAPGLRRPNSFTKFDFRDDLKLSRFRTDDPAQDRAKSQCRHDPYRGPFPILGCTLNLGGSSDLSLNTRHSASFTLTPLRCGSARARVGYAPTYTPDGSFAGGVPLGQAVAISGAAVSSNMGYNTSPLVSFLLTMFNVRLGWWFPNPGRHSWHARGLNFSLLYLTLELLGIADEKRRFLNISDGGHFENLAVYELIRRRCKVIIACDAECDENLQFGGLGNMIRICETDFGAVIDIDVRSIRPQKEGFSLAHCAVGQIKYSNGDIGHLIYLKASMTSDEDVSIAQYRASHPSFPHETTADQFFSEDQFESYRKLGLHTVRRSFKGTLPGDDPLMTAERLADVLTPAGCASESFVKQSHALQALWEKFRISPNLLPFMNELITLSVRTPVSSVSDDELCIGLELIQLMEDVFLDLRLDDFWEHPDNRGWAILLMRWSRSPRLRFIWEKTRRTFSIRFEYFCHARLGLTRDQPIARI